MSFLLALSNDSCHVIRDPQNIGLCINPSFLVLLAFDPVRRMSFPVNLSSSPVTEAFAAVPHDPVLEQELELSKVDVSLLQRAEDHVLQYTLSSPVDSADYAQLLLKLLDKASALHVQRRGQRRRPSQSSLNGNTTTSHSPTAAVSNPSAPTPLQWPPVEVAPLPAEQALQLLNDEDTQMLVVVHYAVSKLCEVVVTLPELAHNNTKKAPLVSLSSTFYPNGILVEDWRPLLRLLMRGAAETDTYSQRTWMRS